MLEKVDVIVKDESRQSVSEARPSTGISESDEAVYARGSGIGQGDSQRSLGCREHDDDAAANADGSAIAAAAIGAAVESRASSHMLTSDDETSACDGGRNAHRGVTGSGQVKPAAAFTPIAAIGEGVGVPAMVEAYAEEDGGDEPVGASIGADGTFPRLKLSSGGCVVILFDLETTGLNPKKDRVIQLAAKVRGANVPQEYQEYCVWSRPPA